MSKGLLIVAISTSISNHRFEPYLTMRYNKYIVRNKSEQISKTKLSNTGGGYYALTQRLTKTY